MYTTMSTNSERIGDRPWHGSQTPLPCASMKLAKFEEARDKMLGEAMQQMTEVNGLAKEHAQQVVPSHLALKIVFPASRSPTALTRHTAHISQIMDAVINNVAAVSRAAFGGRKKLMTAAASLMTEVKEEVSSIPGLMKVSDVCYVVVSARRIHIYSSCCRHDMRDSRMLLVTTELLALFSNAASTYGSSIINTIRSISMYATQSYFDSQGSPKKKASTTAGGVGDDGDGGGDADGDEEGGGGGMLDTKQLNKVSDC